MAHKENQRVKLTRQLLKNSLIELMHAKPISKITIKEICGNADINRSTFYLYYADQYALLSEIEDELLFHAQKHLEKIHSSDDSMQYLRALLGYIEENADIFRTLLCRQESLPFQTAFTEASFSNLKINLKLNCSEHVLDYVYSFLVMGSLSMIKKWIEADFDMSKEDMAELLFHLSDNATSTFDG